VKERRANSRKWIKDMNGNMDEIYRQSKDLDLKMKKLERQIE